MILLWFSLWIFGGWLIVSEGFTLPRRQRALTGVALGLVLETWLANLLAHFLPVTWAFWAAAILTLLIGLTFAWPRSPRTWDWRSWLVPGQWLALLLLWWIFTGIERGLNIFDDYQNVPTTSLLAAGDLPPHFPFDPSLRFGYHYFLLLMGAQVMRLGEVFPWNALDLMRAFVLALVILLTYLWVRRLTRSRLAGTLGAAFYALASGTRWMLLLLPPVLTQAISAHITLIGSSAQTAPDLAQALLSPWRIEGAGPLPFPFAYLSGLNGALIMAHGGTGGSAELILLLFLLLYRRWQRPKHTFLFAALFAAWALTTEYPLLLFPLNLLLALAFWLWLHRSRHIPASLWRWIGALALAAPFIAFQGGVLTELVRGAILRLTTPLPTQTAFHTFNFSFSLPSVVSGHLGFLSLLQPAQLLAFFLELGPILLALPLVLAWGGKMIRRQQWWEAALICGMLAGSLAFFVKYSGSAGPSANARLLAGLTTPLSLYAFPLAWTWARRRSEGWRVTLALLAVLTTFAGTVLLGIELIAAQKPVFPVFIQEMDARMAKRYWNRLPPDAVIFDPLPPRAPTIFARPTNAYIEWRLKPEWEALATNPDPSALRAAGFDYLYFGIEYWESLSPQAQAALMQPCVKKVDEVSGYRSPTDFRKDFRRLLDIRECR